MSTVIKYKDNDTWKNLIFSIENGGTGGTDIKEASYNIIGDPPEYITDSNPLQDDSRVLGVYGAPLEKLGTLFYMQANQVWDYINRKLNSSQITNGTIAGNGLDDGYTGTYNKGMLRIGDKIEIRTDNEGGNINLRSPSGIRYEFDAYNGNLRIYSNVDGVIKQLFTLKYSDGSLTLPTGSLLVNSGGTSAKTADNALKNLGFPKMYTGYRSNQTFSSIGTNDVWGLLFTDAEYKTVTGHSYDPTTDIVIINGQQGHDGYYSSSFCTAAYKATDKNLYVDGLGNSSTYNFKINYTIITWAF